MKPLKPSKKWILAAIGFLLVLLVLKITVFFTAKPKVTVDYVAEYNRMTRPQNFDPNENAVEFYQKAIDSFVEMPVEFKTRYLSKSHDFNDANNYPPRGGFGMSREFKIRHIDWPADFNDANQNTLKEWLTSNEQAFEYFKTASRKPYYWLERGVREDIGMSGMLFPELAPLRILVEAIIWNAKSQTTEGRIQAGFEDILTCYRAGQHKCRTPSLLPEQLLGLGTKENALTAAICILDRVKIDPTDLKIFQDAMQAEFNKDVCFPDFEAEKILLYDKLQRTFIDNGKGSGRLAWSVVKDAGIMCGSSENFKFRKKLFLSCLSGPTKNEMVKRIEETFALFASAIPQTPWQLHSQGSNYFEKLNTTPCDDCGYFSFDIFFPPPSPRLYYKYYQVKAREEALLTILAIQRFRAEKKSLPSSLEELVSVGYLLHLPLDPYSNGALVYRLKGDSFTLYSVGENFKDDGGKEPDKNASNPSGDIVFWPVKKNEQRMKRLGKYIDESKDANTPAVNK